MAPCPPVDVRLRVRAATYSDMKGWIVIDPLTTDWSGIAGKRPSDAKHSLQQLIAHIAAKKLEDDVVCKLSVPLMGLNSGTHEIDIRITDVIVMLAVGMNHGELHQQVSDMRERVRRNDLNQQMFTSLLMELRSLIDKTFVPCEIVRPIIAKLQKSGLTP